LTALYAQGETDEEIEKKQSKSVLAKEKNRKILQIIFISGLAIITLILLFMINTMIWVPIVIASILAIILLINAVRLSQKKKFLVPFLFISTALLILGLSFKIWLSYFHENPYILLGLIASNCIMWLVSGLLLKLPYFTLSGAIGFILVILFLFFS
jgi:Flp pilus assembly protein TadB